MILAYDPVAKELVVDLENGHPPFEIAVPEVQFKVWADGGTLSCLVKGADIELMYYPLRQEGARLHLLPVGPHRYQVAFTFDHP